uniref:Uncharacterized protein n=1 Tax=Panagrolaimus superbus TaxID=310955 RepID=A0A914Z5S0_9BILA
MVTTPPPGRRRRSINNDEIPNSLNILTKYEFDQKNNDKNANLLEAQFKKLVQNEKYNGSELQNRTISDDDGYLHISYSFPPNSEKYCYEIQDLYETAFYKIDQAAQALITCEV